MFISLKKTIQLFFLTEIIKRNGISTLMGINLHIWPLICILINIAYHLTLIRLGYFGGWERLGGGGGGHDGPPLISRPWIARSPAKNFHNGSVRCNLQDCIFRFSKIFLLYFILINYANLCKKSGLSVLNQ